MIRLSDHWIEKLMRISPRSPGRWVLRVSLRTGQSYDGVIADSRSILQVPGYRTVPFEEAQIATIEASRAGVKSTT